MLGCRIHDSSFMNVGQLLAWENTFYFFYINPEKHADGSPVGTNFHRNRNMENYGFTSDSLKNRWYFLVMYNRYYR